MKKVVQNLSKGLTSEGDKFDSLRLKKDKSTEIKFDKQLRRPLPSAERIINSLNNIEISSFESQEKTHDMLSRLG